MKTVSLSPSRFRAISTAKNWILVAGKTTGKLMKDTSDSQSLRSDYESISPKWIWTKRRCNRIGAPTEDGVLFSVVLLAVQSQQSPVVEVFHQAFVAVTEGAPSLDTNQTTDSQVSHYDSDLNTISHYQFKKSKMTFLSLSPPPPPIQVS